ncbi:hypothetical protein KVP10_17960 [Candidimonas humi]|uniref:Uncharacterized protein n=1 Tax=Candidimonas humi TaxID=683355 RepID=A0ABV8P2D3_9BURK|nr:hypothetical protein [Candidimonas humi]MBV6306777.1 hypothetical protein [Candidimonas humi]
MTQEQFSALVAEAQAAQTKVQEAESKAKEVVDKLNELLAEAKAVLGQTAEVAPKLATATAEVEANRMSAQTHAGQAGEAQARAAEIRGELETILATAQQSQGAVDAAKQSVDGLKDSASQTNADILNVKATADVNAKAIEDALGVAKASAETAKGLADVAETVDQRVKDYEAKLKELSAQCDEQLEEIKKLLPGATSAGLASAFDKRRQTFLNPGKHWQLIFVLTVIVLIAASTWSLIEVYQHASATNGQMVMFWLSRVPVAAALVWLAMHASREAALAKRLEEDYGFKVSVASSFQGFQEQMQIVGGSAANNEPLKALCDATLTQILNPPGRIYERHSLAVSPTSELGKMAQTIADIAKAVKLPTSH